jgi:hypothetical protein
MALRTFVAAGPVPATGSREPKKALVQYPGEPISRRFSRPLAAFVAANQATPATK